MQRGIIQLMVLQKRLGTIQNEIEMAFHLSDHYLAKGFCAVRESNLFIRERIAKKDTAASKITEFVPKTYQLSHWHESLMNCRFLMVSHMLLQVMF